MISSPEYAHGVPGSLKNALDWLVGDTQLSNALSLNAGVVQLARVVGPAVAGLLIETVGSGPCFALNATSYLVIVVCVASLDGSTMMHRPPVPRAKGQAREGFRYVLDRRELRNVLLVSVVVGVFASNPLPYEVTIQARFGSTVCALVSLGLGIAIVDEFTLAAEQWPRLRALDIVEPTTFQTYVIHRKDAALSTYATRFVSTLRSEMEAVAANAAGEK